MLFTYCAKLIRALARHIPAASECCEITEHTELTEQQVNHSFITYLFLIYHKPM